MSKTHRLLKKMLLFLSHFSLFTTACATFDFLAAESFQFFNYRK